MIRTFLTTTALTALLTAGAFAQDAAPATTDPNAATTNATSQPLDMVAGYMSADTDNDRADATVLPYHQIIDVADMVSVVGGT